jgi:hypothetical protein
MSTFPYVQVEGALSLPHIRPLACLPPSFGREWMLTPPHFSLRAELRALYAAMLRTMCLTNEAFRAAVHWSRYAPPAGLTPSTQNTRADAATAGTRGACAQNTLTASPGNAPPPDRSKLTGGAVAIGGAALLAWIVASHAPHEVVTATSNAEPRPAAKAAIDASQRLAEARKQHEHTVTGAVQEKETRPSSSIGAVAPAFPVAVASHVVGTPTQALAKSSVTPGSSINDTEPSSAVVPATPVVPQVMGRSARTSAKSSVPTGGAVRAAKHKSATAHAQPDFNAQARAKTAAPARLVQREAHGNARAVGRTAGLSAARHHDAHKFAPYREARPLTTHRSQATYSEANQYSPRQPAAKPTDEYASLLTYANTYRPARASNRPSAPSDSTDWVNHVSQRRVTEVPDRFAK